jgi:hypothetical protein
MRRPRKVRRDGAIALVPAIAFWWEAKANKGTQRPGQYEFQQLAEACGELYCLGTAEAMARWLVERGFCIIPDPAKPFQLAMAPRYAGLAIEGE